MSFGSLIEDLSPWERVADVYEPQQIDFGSILPDLSLDILDNLNSEILNQVPSTQEQQVTKPSTNSSQPLPSKKPITQVDGVEEALSVSLLIRADFWGNVQQVSGDLKSVGLKSADVISTNIFNLIDPRNPQIFSLLNSNCDVFMTDYSRLTKYGSAFVKSLVTITRCKETRTILSYEILERYHNIGRSKIESLKRRAHGLKQLVELSGDIVCQIDEQGNFTYVSPAAEEAWGFSCDQLLKMNFWDTINQEQSGAIFSELMNKNFSRFVLSRITRQGFLRAEEVCSRKQGNKINMICREWKDVSDQPTSFGSQLDPASKLSNTTTLPYKTLLPSFVSDSSCSSDTEIGDFTSSPSPSPSSPTTSKNKSTTTSTPRKPKEFVFVSMKPNKVTKSKQKKIIKTENLSKFQLMTSIIS